MCLLFNNLIFLANLHICFEALNLISMKLLTSSYFLPVNADVNHECYNYDKSLISPLIEQFSVSLQALLAKINSPISNNWLPFNFCNLICLSKVYRRKKCFTWFYKWKISFETCLLSNCSQENLESFSNAQKREILMFVMKFLFLQIYFLSFRDSFGSFCVDLKN